jgi:hypothetical protein
MKKTRVATIKKTMQRENYIQHRRNQGSENGIYKLTFVSSMNRPIIFMNDPNAARQTTGYQKYEHEANNTGSLSRKYNTD